MPKYVKVDIDVVTLGLRNLKNYYGVHKTRVELRMPPNHEDPGNNDQYKTRFKNHPTNYNPNFCKVHKIRNLALPVRSEGKTSSDWKVDFRVAPIIINIEIIDIILKHASLSMGIKRKIGSGILPLSKEDLEGKD